MKKFFAAVCCMMLVAGSVSAQEHAAPAAPAPKAVVAPEAVAVPAAPAPEAVQETAVAAPAAGCTNCGSVMAAPTFAAPAAAPVAEAAPAPAASCGCEAAPAPTCCGQRTRRYVVRGAVSSFRARRSSCGCGCN